MKYNPVLFTLLLLLCCLQAGCISPKNDTGNNMDIVIILPDNAITPIKLAAEDLKQDLAAVGQLKIDIVKTIDALPNADLYYLIGQSNQLKHSTLLSKIDKTHFEQLKPRASLLKVSEVNSRPLIILSGLDIQGTQYAVYEYSQKILGIDPLAYWTDKQPTAKAFSQLSSFENMSIAAPVVPLLVYFENDVDELLNLKSPSLEYDWDSFTNMIDSLVRLKYNGIEMFDMLGRIEFYTRPAYLERHPDYQLNVPHLEKMMQYVHDKGMYIQVDMMQGRQLHTLNVAASTCWTNYKQDWIDGWRYYLTHTPVKNIDIFALRPRNQLLDWEYKSSCGEDKVSVFNEVYVEFNKIVNEFKPDAPRVCICYSDGMEMFNNGFAPPKDFIIAWSDDGWGTFKYQPDSTKGYKFGTYMHAGYWKNHDVMSPYPELVESVMDQMYTDYDATHYMEVNGQTFRPFILNIEAYAQSANLGKAFNAQQFYKQWITRYFGDAALVDTQQALEYLFQANDQHIGYVEILWHVKTIQAYLADIPVRQPGKNEFTVTKNMIDKYLPITEPKIHSLQKALKYAQIGSRKNTGDATFYHDHIILPIKLYLDLLQYNQTLIDLVRLKDAPASSQSQLAINTMMLQGREQLQQIYSRRQKGDLNPKWGSWYLPQKRRPNNGFPTLVDFDKIATKLSQ
ncbi:MAG: glycosyl hydrolase 115 family protein [Paraglaciecola sp.]|uniref:glycosyl hydrolase 115 family protein n=1 Tax=Paraglaciecola sp. TaxID=1920173 RepID=UPI003298CF50